jgi:hypothetical protein
MSFEYCGHTECENILLFHSMLQRRGKIRCQGLEMKSTLIQFLLISVAVSSCTSYAYYQSPLQANANTYKPIPMQKDSVKSATYVSGGISAGGANVYYQDGNKSFTGGLHRAHNFGKFQGYYGIRGVIGTYRVDSVHNNSGGWFHNDYLDEDIINANANRKFYGAAGAFGSLNLVIARNWGELRIIGAELSWDKEFGEYLDFRKSLHDTSANIIERGKDFLALAISSDFVFVKRAGSVGFKVAFVNSLRNMRGFNERSVPMKLSSGYLSSTVHYQHQKLTASMQLNMGTYAIMFMAGATYRLSK